MKKLVKMVGLLLIAGALLAGCNKDADGPADIVTNEVVLSNGTWESEQLMVGESESSGGSSSFKMEDKSTFDVDGEKITLKSNWNSIIMQTTYPDSANDATIQAVKEFYDMIATFATLGGKTASSTQEGKTLTFSMSGDSTAAELAQMNDEMSSASEYKAQFPSSAVIKTNERQTVYEITWSENYDDPEMNIVSLPCTCTMTIKKQ